MVLALATSLVAPPGAQANHEENHGISTVSVVHAVDLGLCVMQQFDVEVLGFDANGNPSVQATAQVM